MFFRRFHKLPWRLLLSVDTRRLVLSLDRASSWALVASAYKDPTSTPNICASNHVPRTQAQTPTQTHIHRDATDSVISSVADLDRAFLLLPARELFWSRAAGGSAEVVAFVSSPTADTTDVVSLSHGGHSK